MQDEADNRLDVALSDCPELFLYIVHREGYGLFDDDVLARLGGGNNIPGVLIVGRAYDHDSNVVSVQHRVRLRFDHTPEVERIAVPLRVGASAADQGAHFRPFILLEGLYVLLCHRPATDDSDAQFLHSLTPSR